MADMRESQGSALGEEREDLALQSSVRGQGGGVYFLFLQEQIKDIIIIMADNDLLVLLCGDCRGLCPFVFIPFIT
jgi:hypothetical protein